MPPSTRSGQGALAACWAWVEVTEITAQGSDRSDRIPGAPADPSGTAARSAAHGAAQTGAQGQVDGGGDGGIGQGRRNSLMVDDPVPGLPVIMPEVVLPAKSSGSGWRSSLPGHRVQGHSREPESSGKSAFTTGLPRIWTPRPIIDGSAWARGSSPSRNPPTLTTWTIPLARASGGSMPGKSVAAYCVSGPGE
jgi:hypothetical protein